MILIAFGTRPEIIKLFPVINEMKRRRLPFRTVFTGQQMDLFRDVRDLIPKPDFSFEKEFSGRKKHNSLGTSYAKICQASDLLFSAHKPDLVLVQGDTTTALAVAQTAFFNGIRVGHVEAGLRTYDLKNPFPEELNRVMISRIAALNFAPTRQALGNLKKEGIQKIYLTGNTVVDAANYFIKELGLKPIYSPLVLVTLHRRENHPIMHLLFKELNDAARENPELEFVLPLHPNPEVSKHRTLLRANNIHVVDPLGYPDMLDLISRSGFIITDSGGLQEEATCFGKKVLIMRTITERPETIEAGLGILAGMRIRRHIGWARTAVRRRPRSPYGTGNSAHKIVEIIMNQKGSKLR